MILGIRRRIDSQEEGEDGGVKRGGGIEGAAEILDSNVGMSDDDTVVIEEGRGAVVSEFGVGEMAQVHADGVDDDLETRVFGEILVVGGEGNHGRRHVLLGGNETLLEPLVQ